MDKKTPGNFGYGDMPADYRMRYKQMIEKHNQDRKKKKKNKGETLQERMSRILYGGSSK
tara:strand:+ start:571 stop:747 length:177 start_codon:yes stop_codon:yes gene_type:complete